MPEAVRAAGQGGEPLSGALQDFFGPRFEYDFSRVRVHTGAGAAQAARGINALAYTVGRDIVFGQGQFTPGTGAGMRLLAHELAHVVQQDGTAGAPRARLAMSSPQDASEREADRVAEAVMDDRPVTVAGGTEQMVARQVPAPAAGVSRPNPPVPAPSTAGAAPGMPRTVKVWVNSFIPHAQISGPPGSECFAGDNRSFSSFIHAPSRTHQEIEFDTSTLMKTIDYKVVGASHEVNCTTGAVVGTDTAPASQLTNGTVARSGSNIAVDFAAEAKNPLVALAPAISFEAVFQINPATRQCWLTIMHDGFPAYEAYVTADGGAGVQVHAYDPRVTGETPRALFPPLDQSFSLGPVTF